MFLSIDLISDINQLEQIRERIAALDWRDGRTTAGATAGAVKQNQQAVLSNVAGRKLRSDLTSLIVSNLVLKTAARPRIISPLMVSKTGSGGYYGPHVDNAVMGPETARFRTDLSFTLFLAESDSYEGGELVIHHAGIMQEIKGEAGQLVLYPASSIHEVRPVISGERIACIGWIESMVADPAQRELLFDLENLRVSLRTSLPRQSAELVTLDKTIANLLRFWATP